MSQIETSTTDTRVLKRLRDWSLAMAAATIGGSLDADATLEICRRFDANQPQETASLISVPSDAEAMLWSMAMADDESVESSSAIWCNGRFIRIDDFEIPNFFDALELKVLSETLQAGVPLEHQPEALARSLGLDAATWRLVEAEMEIAKPRDLWRSPCEVAMAAKTLTIHRPPADPSPSLIHICGVVDPLGRNSQSLILTIEWMHRLLNASVHLVLNPSVSYAEYPINCWLRQVIKSPSGGAAVATFELTTSHTLTLALHTPLSWLVRPKESRIDLDNIRSIDIPLVGSKRRAKAMMELRGIFVEGTAREIEKSDGENLMLALHPAAGNFQVEHSALSGEIFVMHTMGYFQLQTLPGIWEVVGAGTSGSKDTQVQLQAGNLPSSSHKETNLENRPGGVSFSSFSWEPPVMRLVTRRGRHVASGGLLSRAASWIWPMSREAETIHIFSLASGAMYERLLRIMMLSVRRHTTRPLKFWLLDEFFSPDFRKLMPEFARRYNLDYELVSYHWPSWVRRQTEKQRVIWGFKILFLDVLFPRDVKRIIYIDADQVVRGDIGKLWDLDIEGRVYAYTPFCDDRPETDGYRFWKSGYWESHLQGRPYHISALYRVDLDAFRQLAAGDQLRELYNALSRDKNSLSNLDQDLPNFAQNSIPIFSLPLEWLWCETWCSNESKDKAMTIDLCNNPNTKEPKLQQAVRIVPEWSSYDMEIETFERQIRGTRKQLPETNGTEKPSVSKGAEDEL